jgi:anaerobic ribonucleoside-triphosphate reductase
MRKIKFKKGEVICHDCKKVMDKGDDVIVYDLDDKGVFYKCSECYGVNRKLENFQKTEVYSRIVGYIRPIDQWNVGKAEEYKDRKEFAVDCC